MIHIRSPADLQRSRLPDNLQQAVSKILSGIIAVHGSSYNPEDDGYIIVVTPTDTDASLSDRIGRRWSESVFEGVSYSSDTRTWHAVYLHNNQCTMSVIVPDAEWLDQGIRMRMQAE